MSSTAASVREQGRRARGLIAEQYDDAGQQHATAQFGMWVFLATEVLFFGVLFAGYAVCRVRDPQGFLLGSQHTEILFGAVEAGILLLSSATVTFAVNLIPFDARRVVTLLLAVTALLGVRSEERRVGKGCRRRGSP